MTQSGSYFIKRVDENSFMMMTAYMPDDFFVECRQTREISKIKLLSYIQKIKMQDFEAGKPDVAVICADGRKLKITRSELIRNYVTPSGKKLRLAFMRNNREYLVCRNVSREVFVFMLPSNYCAMLCNGQVTSYGTILIANKNEDGTVNKQTIRPISLKAFRKSYVVPEQEIITRHANERHHKYSVGYRKSSTIKAPKKHVEPEVTNKSCIGINNVDISENTKPKINPIEDTAKYPLTCTNAIVNLNNKRVGYVIVEKKTGRKKKVAIPDMMKLCNKKYVDNVELVRADNGKMYLRGNRISLDNLPVIIVK